MRLKRLIAENMYLKEHTNVTPFDKADSNTQDRYCRLASAEIHPILHGYIGSRGWLGKLVRGCIRDFVNAHGVELNNENFNSLAKRIISRLKGQLDEQEYAASNRTLLTWLERHNEKKYVLKLNGLDWEELKDMLSKNTTEERTRCKSH